MLIVGLYSRHSMVPSFALIGLALIAHVRWHRGYWPVPSPLVLAALVVLTSIFALQTLFTDSCRRCATVGWQMLPFIWLIGFAAAAAPLSIFAELKWRQQVFKWTIVLIAMTLSLLTIELLFDAPVYRWAAGRSAEELVSPARFNRTAALLTLLVWPCAGWYLCAGPGQGKNGHGGKGVLSRRGSLLLLSFAAVAAINAISDSETSAIGFALACGFLALSYRVIGLGLLLVMLVAVVLLLGFQQMAKILPVVLLDWPLAWPDSLWHRFEIWQHTAAAITERSWQGWGFDGYREIPFPDTVRDAARFMVETPTHPHNAGLQLRVELGIAGSLVGILVVLAVARAIWIGPPMVRPWALGAAITAAIIAEMGYGLWQGSWLAMIGLTVVLYGLLMAPPPAPST